MNRKQILAIAVIVLTTTFIGILLTATLPIWLTAVMVMPDEKRRDITDTLQTKMAREMMKFMFRSKGLRAVALCGVIVTGLHGLSLSVLRFLFRNLPH